MARLIFIALLVCALFAHGQIIDWEELIDPEAGEERAEELLEFFQWRQAHPLEINRARAADWQQFPWINAAAAAAIVAARQARGGFRRVTELQTVQALSEQNYRRLLPFIMCSQPKKRATDFKINGRHRWVQTRPASPGSDPDALAGDGARWYQRLRLTMADRLQAGLVLEKDPGESSPADLARVYGNWEMPWLSGRLCLGAFALSGGQGLLFPRSGQWGGGFDPIAGCRPQQAVLRPSLSARENGGQQGAALALGSRAAELIVFQSRAAWDASLEEGEISALQWSGLHRSDAEISKRAALTAANRGVIFLHRAGKKMRLGLAWQEARYSRSFVRKSDPEDRHDFCGARNWNAGFQAEFNLQKVTGFGELARCRGGGMAMEGGALLSLGNMEGVVRLRRYSADYHRLLSSADDGPHNEQGGFLAWQVALPRGVRAAAAFDAARSLAPAWRQPTPFLPRREATIMVTWQPMQAISCFHRLRFKSWSLTESVDDRFGNPVKQWRDHFSWSALAQMEYQQQALRWRMRLEYRCIQLARGGPLLPAPPDSSGWMLYQQLSSGPRRPGGRGRPLRLF